MGSANLYFIRDVTVKERLLYDTLQIEYSIFNKII